MNLVTISTCSLNQWSLDYSGNYSRIKASILEAKKRNSKIRVGSELEITPVLFKNLRYNCAIAFLNGRIELIRPKIWMASDGNYRELRWFTPWPNNPNKSIENMRLPSVISSIYGQYEAPFGNFLLRSSDLFTLGIEICEELFVPISQHSSMYIDGADIIVNPSGSHTELRKLHKRIDLIKQATQSCGGVYVYSNQRGCDGERLYFDGSSMILCNGKVYTISDQFTLLDVDVSTATIDLEAVVSYRAAVPSIGAQSADSRIYPIINIDFDICGVLNSPSSPIAVKYYTPEQEINLGPACWMWDYLRRSKMGGFFLPLSGGIDSCSVALIAYSMCDIVYQSAQAGNQTVISDIRSIIGLPQGSDYIPSSPKELSGYSLS
ncbi:Glutamine-dependent NAD(+) synthetase [Smittium mucronatum]|uniref:NAD(+) synthase (glutamine-hydrolyzing) n=1 Tax=Smittium mucronatum TaxID=133383 RepID=A0A1R0GTI8_9FUNG|nr:Glutamine-dependent NAD(+) synthetase [Smittium mucronatum]